MLRDKWTNLDWEKQLKKFQEKLNNYSFKNKKSDNLYLRNLENGFEIENKRINNLFKEIFGELK